ncbi:hypothetical protein [Roseibium sp.]
MSNKAASPAPAKPAAAALINHYKPVGIAALSAAALCLKTKTARK